ncbi:LysR family transcriptional regulator [uncultured Roseovarius sp.]|uniref:LysR family transcriptional regulator n=1 Tax=uncultured Roseovarius sp. TaxID=293344 RepID=UPI00262CEBFB|nr:LysR family transcriptional regulator [uncultured Roseovarius sp.]
MKKSKLSLKWVEVFQLVARGGSVQSAAEQAGLSVSTVSHHLSKLEETLGTPLFDHSRRPMPLTSAGAGFLRNAGAAMRLLRQAEIEAQSRSFSDTRNLTLALVEDFDSEIAPELARILYAHMPNCAFRHLTRPSHEILTLLRDQDIDIGVATQPQFDQPGLIGKPLLRDPFVLAVPLEDSIAPEEYLNGNSKLPFLRYSQSQIIGSLIEAQLRRLRITLPNRFEFESNQSIMNMVADGCGWAITTPTCYARARRFHRQLRLVPFPGKGFSRTLSVFTAEIHDETAKNTVVATLRQLIQTRAIDPAVAQLPWLNDQFCLLKDQDSVPSVDFSVKSK